MDKKTTVRVARVGDCAFVFSLAKEMATSFEVKKADFDVSFDEILDDPGAVCLVAEKDGAIIGYLIGFDHRAFYANGRVSWVEEIFVKEKDRKGGAGKSLMGRFEDWCMGRGSKLIALATRRASGFYKAIDYDESATFFRKRLNEADGVGRSDNTPGNSETNTTFSS